MNLPDSPGVSASISACPQAARLARMRGSAPSMTAREAGPGGVAVPATRSRARRSRRSTVSPAVRQGVGEWESGVVPLEA